MLHMFLAFSTRLTCCGMQEGHETIQNVQKGKNKCRFLRDFPWSSSLLILKGLTQLSIRFELR